MQSVIVALIVAMAALGLTSLPIAIEEAMADKGLVNAKVKIHANNNLRCSGQSCGVDIK